MPRPRKCRRVCQMPSYNEFAPKECVANEDCIILTVDEYETIRLIDQEGYSQEECSLYMNVARTTVQQMYTSARKKIALMLVEGKKLKIEGGDYRLCDEKETCCHKRGCHPCPRIK